MSAGQTTPSPVTAPVTAPVALPNPPIVTMSGPVTIQGEVKVINDDTRDAKTKTQEEQKKKDVEERTLKAAQTAAKYTMWSSFVAIGVFVLTLIQLRILYTQLGPTLNSLRIQATITRLNQVKQRLDSLSGGNHKVSEEALFTIEDEDSEKRKGRINHIADQLCHQEHERRPAVESLIRQWFDLEDQLDKQTLPGRTKRKMGA